MEIRNAGALLAESVKVKLHFIMTHSHPSLQRSKEG
jgi:hypothetical protein